MSTTKSETRGWRLLESEEGFALFGVFLSILMMTTLGIAAVTMTGLENRMAGFANTTDAGAAAAEACIGTGTNIILQTLENRQVPAAYIGVAAAIPVNAENAASPPTLTQEIMGQADNNADFAVGTGASPDIQMAAGPFGIVGDIDRLYIKQKTGGSLQFANGYEGTAQGASGGGAEAYYQIDCIATLTATGTTSRVMAIYACVGAAGESCQRKI